MNDKTLMARVSILNVEPGLTADGFRSYMIEAVTKIQNEVAGRPVAAELHVLLPDTLVDALGRETIEEAVTKSRALCPAIIAVMLVPVDKPLTQGQLVEYAASAKAKLSAKVESAIRGVQARTTLH